MCFTLEYASPGRWLNRCNLIALKVILISIKLVFIDGSQLTMALSLVGLKESIQIIHFHNLTGGNYETTI